MRIKAATSRNYGHDNATSTACTGANTGIAAGWLHRVECWRKVCWIQRIISSWLPVFIFPECKRHHAISWKPWKHNEWKQSFAGRFLWAKCMGISFQWNYSNQHGDIHRDVSKLQSRRDVFTLNNRSGLP